jgi:hypothetical protein
MPELYRSVHQHIEYYPEYSLIKRVLTGQAHNKNWPDQQEEWLEYVRLVRLHRPRNVLINAKHSELLPIREIQDWINYHVITAYNDVQLEKWAMVIPPEFLQQVAIEQTMEANPKNTFEIKYFESEYDALQWILSNNPGDPPL